MEQTVAEYTSYLLAVLAVWILLRCARSLLTRRSVPDVTGALELSGKEIRELRGRECLIGRASSSDAVLDDPSVQKLHAMLSRGDDGVWVLRDLSRGATFVGSRTVEGEALLKNGERLRFGTVSAKLNTGYRGKKEPEKAGHTVRGSATLLLLTIFEFCLLIEHIRSAADEHRAGILAAFCCLAALGWGLYLFERRGGDRGFEPESIALLLTAVGFSVAASSRPEAMLRQSALFAAGLALYVLLGLWLRDRERAMKFRWAAGGLGLALLGLTLLTSRSIWGAKNWLILAGNSLQPSEFVKIAFVYTGAVGLDGMLRRRQVLPFTAFSAAIVGTLALMGDFGTALVFFAAFLVIVIMRSGSVSLAALALASAAAAAALVLQLRPYVAARFSGWGRAWEDPLGAGYQQVRAMSALASGGLFGRGAGSGWLTGVVAADTDLVFAVVCEELGLITGICTMLSLLLLAVYARRCAGSGRSGGYAISAAGAVTAFMVQMGLNVFGSMDLVPFTGVTFPFVSRGGSSLIACWGLLAFVKAAGAAYGGTAKKAPAGTGTPAAKKTAPAAKKPAENKPDDTTKPAEKKPATAAKPAAAAKKPAAKQPAAKKTAAAEKKQSPAEKKPGTKKGGTKGAGR